MLVATLQNVFYYEWTMVNGIWRCQIWNTFGHHTTISYCANWRRRCNTYRCRSPSYPPQCNIMTATLFAALIVGVKFLALYTNYRLKMPPNCKNHQFGTRRHTNFLISFTEPAAPMRLPYWELPSIFLLLLYKVRDDWLETTLIQYSRLHTLSYLKNDYHLQLRLDRIPPLFVNVTKSTAFFSS